MNSAVITEATCVLVVDDDDDFRALACMALEVRGHQVEDASSAADALALLGERGEEFMLVITDHRMPEMTGRQLRDTLATSNPDLAVCVWSAFPDLGADAVVKGMDSLERILDAVEGPTKR